MPVRGESVAHQTKQGEKFNHTCMAACDCVHMDVRAYVRGGPLKLEQWVFWQILKCTPSPAQHPEQATELMRQAKLETSCLQVSAKQLLGAGTCAALVSPENQAATSCLNAVNFFSFSFSFSSPPIHVHFRRAAFSAQLKSKIGNILAKAVFSINRTSSLSLRVPLPHTTQCMGGV